ncbi:hypothetical protein EB796_022211 [Bugula neritina]|uniref:Uncharacterized protein n=1 Tax=Bugula neritina TaxID=10212 RepID=A0A7J7IZX7_BUGNE|nr:hypothetical protein EB796_022211 [Bugula neritina]
MAFKAIKIYFIEFPITIKTKFDMLTWNYRRKCQLEEEGNGGQGQHSQCQGQLEESSFRSRLVILKHGG